MLFVPVGIFVARFGRGKYTWFPAHRSIQGFSYVIIIIAAILAAVAMRKEQSGHSLGKHAKSGLGVLILFLIQAGLGSFTHYYRAKTGRRWFGYVHMPLGIIIVGECFPHPYCYSRTSLIVVSVYSRIGLHHQSGL